MTNGDRVVIDGAIKSSKRMYIPLSHGTPLSHAYHSCKEKQEAEIMTRDIKFVALVLDLIRLKNVPAGRRCAVEIGICRGNNESSSEIAEEELVELLCCHAPSVPRRQMTLYPKEKKIFVIDLKNFGGVQRSRHELDMTFFIQILFTEQRIIFSSSNSIV